MEVIGKLTTEAADSVQVYYFTLIVDLLMACCFFAVLFVAETKGRQVLDMLVSVFTKFNGKQLKCRLSTYLVYRGIVKRVKMKDLIAADSVQTQYADLKQSDTSNGDQLVVKRKIKNSSNRKLLIMNCIFGFMVAGSTFVGLYLNEYTRKSQIKADITSLNKLIRVHDSIYGLQTYSYERLLTLIHPDKFSFLDTKTIADGLQTESSTLEQFESNSGYNSSELRQSYAVRCQIDTGDIDACLSLVDVPNDISTEELVNSYVHKLKPFITSTNVTALVKTMLKATWLDWESYSYVAKKATLKSIFDSISQIDSLMASKTRESIWLVSVCISAFVLIGMAMLRNRYDTVLGQSKAMIRMLYLLPDELLESNAYALNFLKSA